MLVGWTDGRFRLDCRPGREGTSLWPTPQPTRIDVLLFVGALGSLRLIGAIFRPWPLTEFSGFAGAGFLRLWQRG